MITRRGFLGSILAAAVAPAIVRADSLMRIIPRETRILPADASVFRIVPTQGPLVIQWVDDSPDAALHAQTYPSGAGGFVAPEGISAVWLTMYAGGGGGASNYGGGGAGGALQMAVKPGQRFVFEKS